MTLLDWKTEYALGIDDVDHEHRQMIDLINEMHGVLEQDCDGENLVQFLGDISVLIGAHFALEERHMLRARYAEYPDHKQDHERLLDEILALTHVCASDPIQGREQLRERLGNWFGVHFKTFDARLHATIP